MRDCSRWIPRDFGNVREIFDLDDDSDTRRLSVRLTTKRADIYAINISEHGLVMECKSRHKVRDAIEQVEYTVEQLHTKEMRVDRTIIIMESFGSESGIFKRRPNSSFLYRRVGRNDIPVKVGSNVQMEMFLRSEIAGSR